MDNSAFTSKLINWYLKTERDLPWRKTKDPYKIWLSEVILQQTRVNQGTPYYLKFIEEYPSVQSLAKADEEHILRLWQGLGYYTRAKNLHKCAKCISEDYGGIFPPNYNELIMLPGIGPYTAAAIASLAFGMPHAVVDGNVQRVLSRYLGISENIALGQVQNRIQAAANELLDKSRPGEFNQAVMDLGATICTPAKPRCGDCPVSFSCFAFQQKLQDTLPIKVKNIKRKSRYFYYWVIRHHQSIVLKKRGMGDIWNGMYEFLLTECYEKVPWENAMGDDLKKILDKNAIVETVIEYKKHVLSHQDIYSCFVIVDIDEVQFKHMKLNYSYQFYSLDQILQLPKPILIDKFLREKII